jgi:hypothetical protein
MYIRMYIHTYIPTYAQTVSIIEYESSSSSSSYIYIPTLMPLVKSNLSVT